MGTYPANSVQVLNSKSRPYVRFRHAPRQDVKTTGSCNQLQGFSGGSWLVLVDSCLLHGWHRDHLPASKRVCTSSMRLHFRYPMISEFPSFASPLVYASVFSWLSNFGLVTSCSLKTLFGFLASLNWWGILGLGWCRQSHHLWPFSSPDLENELSFMQSAALKEPDSC